MNTLTNFTCEIPLMLTNFVACDVSCIFNPDFNVHPMNYKRSTCRPHDRFAPVLSSFAAGFPLCISSDLKTSTF